MEKFASIELTLNKNVKKGEPETLLSLFNFKDRIKHMDVLLDMDEGQIVVADCQGLGKIDLALGNDMEKGQQKTIMTLFWHDQKSKEFKMEREGKAGEKILLTFWKKI